ncbi:MAG: hypothetical protein VX899_04225 [Myxococcota bacterium]|nr:hypothetical protein [Myxococcota bacterium]
MPDDIFDDAVRIGERNREIIRLCQNWCTHIRVEGSPFLGVGIVEQMTGLPVSGGFLACQFASEPSMTGMNLKPLAVEFVDLHCRACNEREPVGLPNVGELLARRDRERQSAAEHEQHQRQQEEAGLASRVAVRGKLIAAAPRPTQDVLSILDEIDRDPAQDDERLLSLATVSPELFSEGVVDAIIQVGQVDSQRGNLCLPVLEALGVCTAGSLLVAVAASGPQVDGIKSSHLIRGARSVGLEPDVVDHAVDNMVMVAAPYDWHGGAVSGDSQPLSSLYSEYPERVAIRIRILLQEATTKDQAARALALIAREHSELVGWAPGELARAWHIQGDSLRFGRRGNAVQRALGDLLAHHPTEADEAISAVRDRNGGELADSWLHAYHDALHMARFDDTVQPHAALAPVVASRVISEIGGSSSAEAVRIQSGIVRWLRDHHPDALAGQHMQWFGAVLAVSRAQQSMQSQESLLVTSLQRMEHQAARDGLVQLSSAVLKTAALAAAYESSSAVEEIADVLVALWTQDLFLAARGVRALGSVVNVPRARGPLVHVAYTCMVHEEQVIRSAGAELYGKLVEQSPTGLPPLLHELAVVQLADPYNIVHQRATEAMRWASLPAEIRPRVAVAALNLALAYSKQADSYGSNFLGALVRLLRQSIGGLGGEYARLLPVISVRLASKSDMVHDRLRLLRSLHGVADDEDEFWVQWADLPKAEHFSDNLWDDWIAAAWLAPVRHASMLADAAYDFVVHEVSAGRGGQIWEATTFLSWGARWGAARLLIDRLLTAIPSYKWTGPRRQALDLRRRALELEEAIARGDTARRGLLVSELAEAGDDEYGQAGEVARARAVQVLVNVSSGSGGSSDLEGAATALSKIVAGLTPANIRPHWNAFAEFVQAVVLLGRAQRAVLDAEPDPGRFLRAAVLRTSRAVEALGNDADDWLTVLDCVKSASDEGGGALVAEALVAVPLPVATGTTIEPADANEASADAPLTARPTPRRPRVHVAVGEWTINGDAPDWSQTLTLTTGTVYDLGIVVSLTGAPENVSTLNLLPRTVEHARVVEAPEFKLTLPPHDRRTWPLELRGMGRLLSHAATSIGARPVQITYEAFYDEESGPDLRVPLITYESTSDGKHSQTGYPEGDAKLADLRRWVRESVVPPASDQHIRDFLVLASKLVGFAASCLHGHTFKKTVSEAEFQRFTLLYLRGAAGLGHEVLEAPKTAGGITDITYRGIPVELKVTTKASFKVEEAKTFADQDLQYAVGNHSRFGAVVVLEVGQKTETPAGIGADVSFMLKQDQPSRAVLLVVVRGRLPAPSSHSA